MTSADAVELSATDIHRFRRLPPVGHAKASQVLQQIRASPTTTFGEVADLTDSAIFDWRRYLARLQTADFIIGPGVVRFTIEAFPIMDPNHPDETGRRIDFVVHCLGGRCVRLHPGTTPIVTNNVSDWRRVWPAGASSPSVADSQAASNQGVRAFAPDVPCTVQFLRTIAPVDRIGRRCATEFLDTKGTELQARSQYRARLETTEHFTRRSFSLLYIILPHLRCAAPGRTSFLCVWCGLPCCFFPKALGGILRPRQRQWRFPVAALAGQLAIATPR